MTILENPPCKYVESTPIENTILDEYTTDGIKSNFFPNDMGVVHMTVEKDSFGRKTWNLQIHIDDRYKDNPPQKWTTFGTYMVLIWDQNDSLKLDSLESQSRIAYLSNIMGDRVYTRVPSKTRYVVWPEFPTGKIAKEENGSPKVKSVGKQERLGRGYNELIIIFNADGSIEKQIRT